jgi:hypothetical protein
MAVAKVQLVLHGMHFPKDKPQSAEQYAVSYAFDIPAAAGGATIPPVKALVDASYDFVCMSITKVTADVQVPIPLKISIQEDSSNGRPLFPSPVYLESVAGSAGQPFVLPRPMLFRAGQNIRVNAVVD